ncbi:UNVERIFIED_CONTAM: hypothetical protein RMT77_007382 [Armadillidium vulgare]
MLHHPQVLGKTLFTLETINFDKIFPPRNTSIPSEKESFYPPFKMAEFEESDGGGFLRGNRTSLSMNVVDQRNGKILFFQEFPTYNFYGAWYDLRRHLENTSPERIIVLNGQGSAIKGMRTTIDYLQSLGSTIKHCLGNDSTWTWVLIPGGKTLFEKCVFKSEFFLMYSSSTHFWLPLSNIHLPNTSNNSVEVDRWRFCQRNGVMGDLCDETSPVPIIFKGTGEVDPFLASIPVIIAAGIRTTFLYQSLRSYLNSYGVVKDNFIAIFGTFCYESIELLKLFNISYVILQQEKESNFYSFYFYKQVYSFSIEKFKNSNYFIFLEEDVEVSKDFFWFMKQAIPLLKKDPTIYCITGHSLTGFEAVAHDESVLLRADVQVGYGYALERSQIKELLNQWPIVGSPRKTLYDFWIRKITGKKECVYPEISRSLHFGIGLFANYFLLEEVFIKPLAKNIIYHFQNLDKMELSLYNSNLKERLKESELLEGDLCDKNYLSTLQPGSYIRCYKYLKIKNGDENYQYLGGCTGSWNLSDEGKHEHVGIVKVTPNITLYFIGHPVSPFKEFCPKNVTLFDKTEIL